MKTFHGKQEIKDKYLARVRAHAAADEIIRDSYWEKSSAIVYTIHSKNPKIYETELGIPEWLARLEDELFEWLPLNLAKQWPERFLNAIPVGVDLNIIKTHFMIFVLESMLDKFYHAKFPEVKTSIDRAVHLFRSEEMGMVRLDGAKRPARLVRLPYAGDWRAANHATLAVIEAHAARENAAYPYAVARMAELAGFAAGRPGMAQVFEVFSGKLIELFAGV
jgi:hypothetical protein